MHKLVETKLQKLILLIGGFLIFLRLLNASYHERYEAIFTSIGIFVLTIVFLIVLQGYHPEFHLKIIGFVKKHRHLLTYLVIFSFLIIVLVFGRIWYLNMQKKEFIKAQEEKYHNAEIAYQKCLDKVASLTRDIPVEERAKKEGRMFEGLFDEPTKKINIYFDEWIDSGRPNYDPDVGHWEWAFMEWMMKKYPEFCKEYNIDLINYFLENKPKIFGVGRLKGKLETLPKFYYELPR